MTLGELATPAARMRESLKSRGAVWWSVAIVLGIVNVIPQRFVMNPDGISYLNLATLYQHGDWAGAMNGYWSPLYPLLIAGTLRLIPASPFWESTVVHALNFVLYLATFAAFRFFLAELRTMQHQGEGDDGRQTGLSFRSAAEIVGAHALFFWAAFVLIGLGLVTPDMAVAALVFVAAGLTIRLRRTRSSSGYILLGAILGLAYLTKAVMFPIGVAMCLLCGFPASFGHAAKRTALALFGFIVVASPQLVAMTLLSGHPSYGESGTIAYANEVNHISKMWVGEPAGTGTPEHPMRRISSNPPAYLFPSSKPAFSFPVSDELAYWMKGVRPHFSIGEQLSATQTILFWYLYVFNVLNFAALSLFFLKRRKISRRYFAPIVTGLATFAIYALVYVETRYIGAWVVVMFLCFASRIEFGRSGIRGARAILAAVAVFCGYSVLNTSRISVIDSLKQSYGSQSHAQFETAKQLQTLGVKPGSRVGAIGYSFNSYWARLAGVQIAMQVPDEKAYAVATEQEKRNVLEVFRQAGAVAVVSTGKPLDGQQGSWIPIGKAGYWVTMLSPAK